MSRRRTLTLSILILTAILFLIHSSPFSPHPPPSLPPANATLGFSTILAVSPPISPRRPSLLWAANLTGLEIVIPPQQHRSDADLSSFRAKEHSALTRGSALAWLGHLDVLRYFLDTGYETALIMEDDADFSLSIRHTQIPLLAAAVRHLLSNSTSATKHHHHHHNNNNNDNDADFWGPTTSWDILYPGHCDDLPSPLYPTHLHLLYHDPSTPSLHLLHPATQTFLSTLNIPSSTRFLHHAFFPFCTFAYAVTRRSARRILTDFGREGQGGVSAFDVALLQACRDGGWGCWSVVPEVFHHGGGGSEIGRVDGRGGAGGVVQRGSWNLGCGGRGVGEGDGVKGLLGEMVGRGECVGDGRERGWVGCEGGECGGQS